MKIMENPIKMDDLRGKPTIFGNIHIFSIHLFFSKMRETRREATGNDGEVYISRGELSHPVCHRCQGASVWTRPKGDGFLGGTAL